MKIRARYFNKETKKNINGVVTAIGTTHVRFHEATENGQLDQGEMLPLMGVSKLSGVVIDEKEVIIMRWDGQRYLADWPVSEKLPRITSERDGAMKFMSIGKAMTQLRRLAGINVGGYQIVSAE